MSQLSCLIFSVGESGVFDPKKYLESQFPAIGKIRIVARPIPWSRRSLRVGRTLAGPSPPLAGPSPPLSWVPSWGWARLPARSGPHSGVALPSPVPPHCAWLHQSPVRLMAVDGSGARSSLSGFPPWWPNGNFLGCSHRCPLFERERVRAGGAYHRADAARIPRRSPSEGRTSPPYMSGTLPRTPECNESSWNTMIGRGQFQHGRVAPTDTRRT